MVAGMRDEIMYHKGEYRCVNPSFSDVLDRVAPSDWIEGVLGLCRVSFRIRSTRLAEVQLTAGRFTRDTY